MTEQTRFNDTIASFDALNAQDPNLMTVDGKKQPKELIYAQRLSEMLDRYAPEASAVLKLATRAQDTIQQVASLLKKENLRSNADMQTLEDVIVLAFLEHDLDAFVQKYSDYPEEKFLTILRKSYMKMSEKGKAAALTLITIPEHLVPVVLKAVG